jgi:hypothetical protein
MTDPNEAAQDQSQTSTENQSQSGSGSTSNGGNGGSSSNGGSSNGNGNGNGKDQSAVASDAGKLLAAEVALNQARVNALATGLQQHQEALEEAQSSYDEQRNSVDDDVLRYAYSTLLDPVGVADQSRQIDTTGLGGFGASSGVVHAANVFGSPVQQAVAAMATQTPADPVTVIGAIPQSDLVDPDSLERAKGRGGKRKKQSNGGSGSSGSGSSGSGSSGSGSSNSG